MGNLKIISGILIYTTHTQFLFQKVLLDDPFYKLKNCHQRVKHIRF